MEFNLEDAVMMIGEITVKERLAARHLRLAHDELTQQNDEIIRLRGRISELAPDDPDGLVFAALEEAIREEASQNGSVEN